MNWQDLISKYCAGLTQNQNGVWCAKSVATISYPEGGNQEFFGIEDVSFWFQHRLSIILAIVRSFSAELEILDFGGGNGFVTKALINAGFRSILVEPGPTGCQNARRRGVPIVIQAGIPFASVNSVPVAGLFDVLEHLPDDVQSLKDIYSTMKKNGTLILTVPAFNSLWSAEDHRDGHYRRYKISSLTSVLEKAQFEVKYISYFFCPLYPLILLLRRIPYIISGGKYNLEKKWVASQHGSFLRFLKPEWLMAWETILISHRIRIPFGSSIIVVATKLN